MSDDYMKKAATMLLDVNITKKEVAEHFNVLRTTLNTSLKRLESPNDVTALEAPNQRTFVSVSSIHRFWSLRKVAGVSVYHCFAYEYKVQHLSGPGGCILNLVIAALPVAASKQSRIPLSLIWLGQYRFQASLLFEKHCTTGITRMREDRITHSQTTAFIWIVANLLMGDFKKSQYGRVILPFTLLRRLECLLEPITEQVMHGLFPKRPTGLVPDSMTDHEKLSMDNYGTHKTEKVRARFAARPRYHVHFPPTISVLNQRGRTIFWPDLRMLDQAQLAPQHSRTGSFH